MNSSQQSRRHFLGVISRRRAEQLLTGWANRPDEAIKFPEITIPTEAKRFGIEDPAESNTERFIVRRIACFIRKAWDAPDVRRFDWYVRKALNAYEDGALTVVDEEPPEEMTPIEAALLYLIHERKRVRRCPNSDCTAPYFFASKKGQKFCSTRCALPSQRESKRKWWDANRAKKGKRNAKR